MQMAPSCPAVPCLSSRVLTGARGRRVRVRKRRQGGGGRAGGEAGRPAASGFDDAGSDHKLRPQAAPRSWVPPPAPRSLQEERSPATPALDTSGSRTVRD